MKEKKKKVLVVVPTDHACVQAKQQIANAGNIFFHPSKLIHALLVEVTHWYTLPATARQIADEQFVQNVKWPEQNVDEEPNEALVVEPTNHARINGHEGVENAADISAHKMGFRVWKAKGKCRAILLKGWWFSSTSS